MTEESLSLIYENNKNYLYLLTNKCSSTDVEFVLFSPD